MLKKVLLNKKFVPVPVPLQNLEQAITWLDSTLVHGDQMITKIVFNGREITDTLNSEELKRTSIGTSDKLEFIVEAPGDLAVQVLETARNIASVLFPSLKALAVDCWQLGPKESLPAEAKEIQADLALIMALIGQYTALGEVIQSDRSILEGIGYGLSQAQSELLEASQKHNGKSYARILLNQVEDLLDQLIQESARLESDLLSSRSWSRQKNTQVNQVVQR